MINKHSHEQSEKGEGVEVVVNETTSDPVHGKGFYTEKRIYLNRYFNKFDPIHRNYQFKFEVNLNH